MALLYFDGFDHYDVTTGSGHHIYDKDAKWLTPSTPNNAQATFSTMPVIGTYALQTIEGPFGGGGTSRAATAFPLPTVIASGDTLGIGFHYYREILPNADNKRTIFGFGSAIDAQTRTIAIQASGQLVFKSGDPLTGTSLANSGANLLSAATLYHIETKIFFHATLGTIEIRVDGVTFLSASNINTLPSSASLLAFAANQEGSPVLATLGYYDDLVIWDTSGSANNDWLGERNVITLMPSADTAAADWTLSTGSSGFDLLNDVPADTATNYIESSTPGDQSTFEISNLASLSVSVIGVQTNVLAQKTASGASEIEFGIVSNGTQSISPSTAVTQSQFKYFHTIDEVDPDTGSLFTPAAINALKATVIRSL